MCSPDLTLHTVLLEKIGTIRYSLPISQFACSAPADNNPKVGAHVYKMPILRTTGFKDARAFVGSNEQRRSSTPFAVASQAGFSICISTPLGLFSHIACETFYMTSPIHGEEKVATWEELKRKIEQRVKDLFLSKDGTAPNILFRGQEDAEWHLETTLERTGDIKQIDVADYFSLADSVYAEVVSKSEEPVSFPPIGKIKSTLRSAFDLCATVGEGLEYLIYLRQRGFPSPLLDWTQDLHTAAFFAFRNSAFTGARSIYVFCEYPNWVKTGWRAEPTIIGLSHQLSQLKSHIKQKAEYTVCVSLYGPHDYWSFSEHDAVLSLAERRQDSLMRFVIPGHQADIVRAELDSRGYYQDEILPSVELDKHMSNLIQQVFGPSGLAQALKIR